MTQVETLSRPAIMWATLFVTVVLTVLFQVVASHWQLSLLDAISDPTEARQVLAGMSPEQKSIHAWITATLDVAYPLAYGALFIGAAYQFFPERAVWLARPTYVLVPIDLIEGVIQVVALIGAADWMDAKAIVTPIKTLLFLFGIVMTVAGCVRWLWQRRASGG